MGQELKTKKYMTGEILLDDNIWLVFKREQEYEGQDCDAITVWWSDKYTQTNSLLGTLYNNRWIHPSPQNANLFWHYAKVKKHIRKMKTILDDLRQPLKEISYFTVEWKCFKRRFKLESIKLSRKIKQVINNE